MAGPSASPTQWEAPYYVIEGLDKTGRRLFTLAANRGFPDAYVPAVLQGGFQPRRPAPLLTGQVVPVKAWSTPAPPAPKPNERLVFGAAGTTRMWLAKGWEWHAKLDTASIPGYELFDGTFTFQVPVMEAVTVPLSLTHLQRLTVLTTGPDTPRSARVTLIGPDGKVIAERDSTRSLTDGKKFGQNHVYSAHFDMLPEGRYTVRAYAPKTTSQPAIHPVFRGAEDTITIALWPEESKEKSNGKLKAPPS